MSKVTISEFIISLLELVEAQVHEIRESLHRSAWGLGFILVASLLLFVAFVFILWGVRLLIEPLAGEIGSYFLTALLCLILVAILAKAASWQVKK